MKTHRSRAARLRLAVLVTVVMALATLGVTATVPAAGAAPYCGITWGSLEKAAEPSWTVGPVTNLRAGRHDCFDRLVIDLGDQPVTGYTVHYVRPEPGVSDVLLSITANALGEGVVNGIPAFNPPNAEDAVDVRGFSTFRRVTFLGERQARTELALTVRARLPFRVLRLTGPGAGHRVVIDVAHRW
jgi:hypothetical protein